MEKAVLSCCSSWNPIGLTDVGLKQCVYKLPWHVTRAQWECSGFSIVISPPWEPGAPHPLSGHIGGWVLTVSSCLAVVQAKAFEVALELLFFSVPTGRFQVFPLRSTFEIYLESSCFSHLSGCYSCRSHWTQWLQLLSYRPTSFQWPRHHMPRPFLLLTVFLCSLLCKHSDWCAVSWARYAHYQPRALDHLSPFLPVLPWVITCFLSEFLLPCHCL